MNKALVSILAAGGTLLLAVGCASTHDSNVYPAEPIVMLSPGVKASVTCTGVQEETLPDGRLQVVARLHNRENRRLEVQADCVFKDGNGFTTGDESPFVMVILTEGSTEDVKFTSMNNLARKYTIRVREAH